MLSYTAVCIYNCVTKSRSDEGIMILCDYSNVVKSCVRVLYSKLFVNVS